MDKVTIGAVTAFTGEKAPNKVCDPPVPPNLSEFTPPPVAYSFETRRVGPFNVAAGIFVPHPFCPTIVPKVYPSEASKEVTCAFEVKKAPNKKAPNSNVFFIKKSLS
ncbi:hypothetical protein D3C80_1308820 [compost metagenome]